MTESQIRQHIPLTSLPFPPPSTQTTTCCPLATTHTHSFTQSITLCSSLLSLLTLSFRNPLFLPFPPPFPSFPIEISPSEPALNRGRRVATGPHFPFSLTFPSRVREGSGWRSRGAVWRSLRGMLCGAAARPCAPSRRRGRGPFHCPSPRFWECGCP